MDYKKEAIFAHQLSDFVNSCSDLMATAAMMACDHRYLIEQKFRLCLNFINVLAMQYEQGKYDARNEFACKQSHEWMTQYGGGERLTSWDATLTQHLKDAYNQLDRFRPYKEREQEDAKLVERVMFALRDLCSWDDEFLKVLFSVIFGDAGLHLFNAHWDKAQPYYFYMALDDVNTRKFISFCKSPSGYCETARRKMNNK